MVGMGLIMIPAITYLALTGATGAAIGLTLWGIIVVGLVDNILSPILVGGRTKMPELLVLLAILGGIQQFGPIGFIIGPVILSGLLVARDLYKAGILDK
jgi:predicted PurR-regulated permease PerM